MQEGQTGFTPVLSWLLQASKIRQSHRAVTDGSKSLPSRHTRWRGSLLLAGKSRVAGLRRGYKDSTAGKYLWRKDAELCMFPKLEMVLIYLLQRLWLFAAGFCWKQLFQAHLLPLLSLLCSWFRIKTLPKPTQTTRNPAPPASGKGGTIFISISDYHGLVRHKAFFEHGTLRTLQISPRV